MAPKINVKERFTDGEIDLSMSDLDEVPLKEIALLKKAFSLDLSNNRLSVLPKAFPTLTHLTKLDLSKNEIKELPEDFGNLVRLRHLDLYRNSLQHLPLSFSKLKDLKWLDLKDNPLVSTVAKVAGPCLDTKQCQSCARDIVNFFSKLEQQVNSEIEMRNKTRQKQLEINQQKKQEEKKAKKKEKQKQKKEIQNLKQNSAENKVKNKKDNNNRKIKAETVKEIQPSESICGKFFKVSFLLVLILFILTACHVQYTEKISMFVADLFKSLLDKVPIDYKPYGVQFGRVFYDFHEKTGKVTLQAVQYLNDTFPPTKRQQFYDDFRNVLHSFLEKVKELYNTYVSR